MPTFSVKYLPLPCSNFNDYFHPPNVSSLGPSVIQTEKKNPSYETCLCYLPNVI